MTVLDLEKSCPNLRLKYSSRFYHCYICDFFGELFGRCIITTQIFWSLRMPDKNQKLRLKSSSVKELLILCLNAYINDFHQHLLTAYTDRVTLALYQIMQLILHPSYETKRRPSITLRFQGKAVSKCGQFKIDITIRIVRFCALTQFSNQCHYSS